MSFETSLTKVGKHNSNTKLFNKLSNIQIDEIYCSPYKRALETIKTFSETNDIPIKVDWALAEYLDNRGQDIYRDIAFPSKEIQQNMHKRYPIDNNYDPTTSVDYITTYAECSKNFERRVDNFILYLYTKINSNILVVTHGAVCNRITEKLMGKSINVGMGECFKLEFSKI